ncbi:MAG: helix-turn-helix domain-containing protein [Treponema sp.]|nr:helix-turn-helix domain-containing protein [Treponema sp.]
MDFWTRLKSEIKAKNTTQEWIAGQIDVPFGTFRKWMTRKTYPDLKEGTQLAKILGVSAEYLITGTEAEGLDTTERKLINAYRKLSTTDKENAILAVLSWVGKNEQKVF